MKLKILDGKNNKYFFFTKPGQNYKRGAARYRKEQCLSQPRTMAQESFPRRGDIKMHFKEHILFISQVRACRKRFYM